MSEQSDLIQWLRDDLTAVKSDVKQINSKVDEMLQFKWQIIGGSVVVSAFIGVLIQILLVSISK